VTHSSLAISSFDFPLASASRIDRSRSVSPAALALSDSVSVSIPDVLKTFPSIACRSVDGRSVGFTLFAR